MDGYAPKDIENLENVWRRVTGITPPRADDSAALRGFMECEAADAAYYGRLAAASPGSARALRYIMLDEREHFRALSLEYYLLTGDTFVPAPSCPASTRPLEGLRLAYHNELSGAERYATAAAETENARLTELYLAHADDERRHAARLRRLLASALT